MFGFLFDERYSFWFGFVAGGLFFWLLGRLRGALPHILQAFKARLQALKAELSTGVDLRFRNDVIRYAQRQHLTASFFSLDEIVIPPRIHSPAPQQNSESEHNIQDIFRITIPFLPDWPELGACYRSPKMSLAETLQGGANLILLGHPGAGKTVAMAHLACQIARRDPEADNLENFLPVLVHISDIFLAEETGDPLASLIDAVSEYVSPFTLPRLSGLLHNAFRTEKVILLLDGLDELAPEMLNKAGQYLGSLLNAYPNTRIVAAASYEYYDGLTSSGLIPVTIAAWENQQKNDFLNRWSELWTRHIRRSLNQEEEIDPLLLNSWLEGGEGNPNPFELTIKVWGAYAGDLLGVKSTDLIETHLLRLTTHLPDVKTLLENIARQMMTGMSLAINLKDLDRLIAEISSEEQANQSPTEPTEEPLSDSFADVAAQETSTLSAQKNNLMLAGVKTTGSSSHTRVMSELIANGLLVTRKNGKVSFTHPIFAFYLAGSALAAAGLIERYVQQPEWVGKTNTLRYLASWNDITEYVLPVLEQKDDPLFRKMISTWRWLPDAPKYARWRTAAMRKIAAMIQQELLPVGLRGRAVAALALSRDPGAVVLFKQFLSHNSETVRQLAALGSGLIKDTKSVQELTVCLDDLSLPVSRAAILALGAIGNRTALDTIAATLLTGREEMRRAAAEILSTLPEEGHPALQEGAAMDDLLVRRAVVYGLALTREQWAIQILEKIQIEDGQWVVRTAATQALEELARPNPHIPQPLPALTQAPWLILFAGKLGMGVSPGKAARDLVAQVLKSGEPQERLAALEYVALYGDETFVPDIYHILYGCEGELREAAFNALFYLGGKGVPFPSPTQFGLG